MRHFHDLYAMKHCHMADGHPRRKNTKIPRQRGKRSPTGGWLKSPPRATPVAPRLHQADLSTTYTSIHSLMHKMRGCIFIIIWSSSYHIHM